jgi:hypothetical protein
MLLSLDITGFMLIKYYKILSNIYDREKREKREKRKSNQTLPAVYVPLSTKSCSYRPTDAPVNAGKLVK